MKRSNIKNKRESNRTTLMSYIFLMSLALPSMVSLPAKAASFDCAKAKTVTEKTICADPKLSALDEEVNTAYQAAKATGDAASVTKQQREWLKGRNACATPVCLEHMYIQRLKELGKQQDGSPVLRQIVRPKDKSAQEKIWSAEEILRSGPKVYPPYPDIWGVELPAGVDVFGVYPAINGDIVVRILGNGKNDFEWLRSNDSNVMTGLFSGKQWRVSKRDPISNKKQSFRLLSANPTEEIPCPIHISESDPDMRGSCYAQINHVFPNGNRLLYVITDYGLPYCYHERYFRYLALLDPNGKVLRQVTLVLVSKNTENSDELGGDPPCEDLPGGQEYKTINSWTMAPEINTFDALSDASFLLGFHHFLMRFDQNFSSRHPAFGKEVFMVDTNVLEKMGNIHTDPNRTIHENALQADRNLYEFLTGKNKERR